MAGSPAEWERYERWNGAIAEVVYSRGQAGLPVYLDLEDSVLASIRDAAEPEATDVSSALIQTLIGTLVFTDGANSVLRGHLRRLDLWHQGTMLDPPPTLGLLALLSLVAKNMQDSDHMRSHNFYNRLERMAGMTGHQIEWFTHAYRARRHSENTPVSRELWGSLNDWLEMLEGSRGLPTAQPMGHDHIGWPLSQALVRQADRDKFVDLFVTQGMPPYASLPASEMAAHIDEWMSRSPCPASNHLERLWKDRDASVRIVDIARLALESWNGAMPVGFVRASGTRLIDTVRVKAAIRSFPSRRLDLALVVPGQARVDEEPVGVLDAEDNEVNEVDLVPIASGWLGVSEIVTIDARTLLEGQVRLRRRDHAQPLTRRARPLVPLGWNEMLMAYVEGERVQLAEKSLILSTNEIAPRVANLLERVARPGFRRIESIPGLPDGWTAFDDVRILSSIPHELLHNQRTELNLLQPMTTSQVVFQGGLRLPGHLRKWLSAMPPELCASAKDDASLSAHLVCIRSWSNPAPPPRSLSDSGTALIWDLADLALPDGDYSIDVLEGGNLMSTEILRLRSADTPALRFDDESGTIGHSPTADGFGIITGRTTGPGAFTCAPDDSGASIAGGEIPSIPSWWKARVNTTRSAGVVRIVKIPGIGGHSCIATGQHYIDLPLGLGQTTIEGVCRYCGLVKRYPTKYRSAARNTTAAHRPPRVSIEALPPVRAEVTIEWKSAFDAVCHVGGGTMASLDRITSQMESTGLFGDNFARQLEVLGHIEIERSSTSLKPLAWQVNDPSLIGLANGAIAIVGFRNDRAIVTIEDAAWAADAELTVRNDLNAPPIVRLRGLDESGIDLLAKQLAGATGRPVRHIADAARRLATSLRPLSKACETLPTTAAVTAQSYERWNTLTARFEETSDASSPGAFRLSGHTRTYIYRLPSQLGAMRASLGDARIVKYLAALDTGISLVGYDEASRVLYVPLGADLPGLYGRAAVFASGRPPIENTDERILEYHNVQPELAAHLAHLLSH